MRLLVVVALVLVLVLVLVHGFNRGDLQKFLDAIAENELYVESSIDLT